MDAGLSSKIEHAVTQLFDRKVSPRPRRDIDRDGAIEIVKTAYEHGSALGKIGSQLHRDDGDFAANCELVEKRAGRAADSLEALLKSIKTRGGYPPDVEPDEQILVHSLCALMGRHPVDDRAVVAPLLAYVEQAQLAVATIQAEVGGMRAQIRSGRQNIGKADTASLITELAYAWTAIIGQPPGKTAEQNDTPFGKFVELLLGEVSNRQIQNAIVNLDRTRVAKVLSQGYGSPLRD